MTNAELDRKAAECLGLRTSIGPYGGLFVKRDDGWRGWHPTESRDQAALLEQEIERRGGEAQRQYWELLMTMHPLVESPVFWLATAPPSARVAAAVQCLEAEGKSE